ncbi:hypothetical protein [Sphingobium sp. KCTC 72723]|uniref:hypothetical protein n=1 Tax=Sphingobium sp. KCTC 72723 TaxID=2733867 RepID=UPI00165E2D68|nr:hypothetical protein [Sphingobium sp. KCTC 72723]
MDELLQKALDRRDELRNELEALDRFIASYQGIRSRHVPDTKPASQGTLFPSVSLREKKAAIVSSMMDEIERAILANEKPMTRSQLLEHVENAGFEVEGGDKTKVLGTNIWRSNRFHNLKGAGYWPKNRDVPLEYAHLEQRTSMLAQKPK